MKKVISFGTKYGKPIPRCDYVYSATFLPNPHRVPRLRDKTGLDREVYEFVLNSDDAEPLIRRICDDNYDTIGVFCIGGKHRSVVIAEEIGKRMNCAVQHRELR